MPFAFPAPPPGSHLIGTLFSTPLYVRSRRHSISFGVGGRHRCSPATVAWSVGGAARSVQEGGSSITCGGGSLPLGVGRRAFRKEKASLGAREGGERFASRLPRCSRKGVVLFRPPLSNFSQRGRWQREDPFSLPPLSLTRREELPKKSTKNLKYEERGKKNGKVQCFARRFLCL